MSKIRPLKIIFGFAAGSAIFGAVTVAAVNIANAALYEAAPTPLEFTASQGMSYSKKTTDYLRQFNDVRVIEATPAALKKFCQINFFTCGKESLDNLGNFAYAPTWKDKIWGIRPTVFLRPYDPNLINTTLKFVSAKTSDVMSEDHSRMMFDFAVFHETGHLGNYHHLGAKPYYALTAQKMEFEADTTALPYMKAEYGPGGTEFVIHLRALTQADYLHDNLPLLKNPQPEASQEDADKFKHQSYLSWVQYMSNIEACTKIDPRNGNMQGWVMDAFYNCVLHEQARKRTPLPTDEAGVLLADRKKSYVQAYNYFFGPPAAP